MKPAAALPLLIALLAACSAKEEYAGIGPYHVKKITLGKVAGRCEPSDLPDGRKGTWCYGNPPVRIAGMNADVDLYFGATDPSSKVIEIQFQFRGCKEGALDAWLRKAFGVPVSEKGARLAWQNHSVYVIGEVPAAPGRCLIRVLPKSEQAEFDRITAQ